MKKLSALYKTSYIPHAAAIFFFLCYFTACYSTKDVSAADIPLSYMVQADNYFDYQSGLECSAFASAYVLRHYGEKESGIELFKTFPGKVSDGGVSPYGIVAFFQQRGYNAEYRCGGTIEDIKKLVSKGQPVIVFIRITESDPHTYSHYIPVVGYDSDYFYFAESLSNFANCKDTKELPYNRKIEITTFKRLWVDIDYCWDYPYFVVSKPS